MENSRSNHIKAILCLISGHLHRILTLFFSAWYVLKNHRLTRSANSVPRIPPWKTCPRHWPHGLPHHFFDNLVPSPTVYPHFTGCPLRTVCEKTLCGSLMLTYHDSYDVTPEILWGGAHGFVGLGFVFWWQSTVAQAAAMRHAKIQ